MLKKILLIILLVSSIYFLVTSPIFAQNLNVQGLDVTVSPPVFDLSAKPGDKVVQTFRLRNNQSQPLPLKVDVRRLISDPKTGNPTPENDSKGEELSWVTVDPAKFTAQPREWSDVKFTIDIPSSAAFGYYYVLRITPDTGAATKTTGTTIKGEVLVVILLNVQKEGAISKANLVSFAPKTFVNEYLPVDFATVLENPGNVHVKPHGNIFITRGGGKDLATLDVNSANGSILPGGKRTFESSWDDGFLVNEPVKDENGTISKDKNGNPKTHLTINWNKLTSLRIGPYTAHLLMVYDDGTRDQTIEAESKFWVIPYTAIGVVVVGLIVIILFIKIVLGAYIRSQIRRGERK